MPQADLKKSETDGVQIYKVQQIEKSMVRIIVHFAHVNQI